MYEFRELIDNIWKTIMRAQDIIEEALENKSDDPDLAATYYHVASDQITDAEMLMKQAEACLAKAQKSNHEEYEDMDILWDSDHKRLIRLLGNVKIYMDMYR